MIGHRFTQPHNYNGNIRVNNENSKLYLLSKRYRIQGRFDAQEDYTRLVRRHTINTATMKQKPAS